MADPTIFEYQVRDDQGLNNRIRIYVAYNGATISPDELLARWVRYGDLIDGCIDPYIVQGRITIPLAADAAWKQAADEGNNVNQVMVLNFENDYNRYLTDILLPGYKEDLLTPENVPDLADANLAAFITEILDGSPAVTPVVFPNSRGLHDLNALREVFLTTRKVRQSKAKTRVIP